MKNCTSSAPKAPGSRLGERPARRLPRRTQLRLDARHLGLGFRQCLACRVDWIASFVERHQLDTRGGRPFEQLAGALGAVPAPEVGEAVELRLDMLEPPRLSLERVEEAAQVGRGLAQLELRRAQRIARARQLWCQPLQRCDGPFGRRDEIRCRGALFGR
jgi:hypothetical protein